MTEHDLPIEIDVSSAKAKLDGGTGERPVLVDCREPNEHDTVRLPGARLIPMSELPERVEELERDRGREIIVYCHHGSRSLMVAQWLRAQGFPHAVSMAGGIDLWAVQIDTSLPRY